VMFLKRTRPFLQSASIKQFPSTISKRFAGTQRRQSSVES
jgi:hypothetical protein